VRVRARRLRAQLIVLGCLLATATVTLAASGVIRTGAPVRPEEALNPNVGDGLPAAGASRLLPLRVPDPEGGLPWGMRIVQTTRQELCVQVGRVQDGQLGELGVDGAFHDDGRFHPLPADALPADVFHGRAFNSMANSNTGCQLTGEVFASEHTGLDRSAAANPHASPRPLRELRDVAYGLLGPDAVSVSYDTGGTGHTEAVLQPIGAYLIVQRIAPGEQIETGGGSLGTAGDLPPSPPLTAITYRLDGKLCQRGPVEPPGTVGHLTDPCPEPHFPTGPVRTADLHRPLHVRLQISHRLITGGELSFTAPFAVSSAKEEYIIRIPSVSCNRPVVTDHGRRVITGHGYGGVTLDGDVARGSTVTQSLSEFALFSGLCGRPPFTTRWTSSSATIEVLYRHAGEAQVLVGSTIVREPPGTHPLAR
jgi:hypothetical protein